MERFQRIHQQHFKNPPESNHLWGYFIIRTTYEDEGLWQRYLSYLRKGIIHDLQEERYGSDLVPYFRLYPIENKAELDGVDIDAARFYGKSFIDRIPEDDCDESHDLPRTRGCHSTDSMAQTTLILVDAFCLQSHADWERHTANGSLQMSMQSSWEAEKRHFVAVMHLEIPVRDETKPIDENKYAPGEIVEGWKKGFEQLKKKGVSPAELGYEEWPTEADTITPEDIKEQEEAEEEEEEEEEELWWMYVMSQSLLSFTLRVSSDSDRWPQEYWMSTEDVGDIKVWTG